MKFRNHNAVVVITLWFFFAVLSPVQANVERPEITEKLETAEASRLINVKEFDGLLIELEGELSAMSAYQLCYFQFLKSYQLAFKGENERSVDLAEASINECHDTRILIRLHLMLANVFVINGRFDKASFHMDQGIKLTQLTEDADTIGLVYSAAAIIYSRLRQYDLSSHYSRLLYINDESIQNLCRSQYHKLREELIKEKTYAQMKLKAALVYDTCIQAKNNVYATLGHLFFVFHFIKSSELNEIEHQEVLDEIKALEDVITGTAYVNGINIYYSILAKLYLLTEELESARQFGELTLSHGQSLGETEQKVLALEVLVEYQLTQENYQQAIRYLKEKGVVEQALFNQAQSQQLAFMTVKHSNDAKEFEVEFLNQTNQVLELEKRLANQVANNQRLLILLVVTLLLFMIYWLVKIKRRHDYFRDVSEVDHLTKVLTRKAFEEQVGRVLSQANATGATVHLSIMDLDHFKQVNDTHGHLVGDWVLKNVVYTCKELIQEEMLFARLGGEEFCLVKPGGDQQSMVLLIEQMRNNIEKLDCQGSGADLTVTASFGITSSDTSGYHLPMLLTHADLALFDAKNRGRNQVQVHKKS